MYVRWLPVNQAYIVTLGRNHGAAITDIYGQRFFPTLEDLDAALFACGLRRDGMEIHLA